MLLKFIRTLLRDVLHYFSNFCGSFASNPFGSLFGNYFGIFYVFFLNLFSRFFENTSFSSFLHFSSIFIGSSYHNFISYFFVNSIRYSLTNSKKNQRINNEMVHRNYQRNSQKQNKIIASKFRDEFVENFHKTISKNICLAEGINE